MAIEIPSEQRAEFVRAQCEEGTIRAEVESLLRSAQDNFRELDRPAFPHIRTALQEVFSSNPNAPLTAGDKIGSYEILSSIGAGGMGEVYRARDLRLKREVALKVLPKIFSTDPERMARFRREAEVLASLNHPNIAQIYGVEDRALVMELVDGKTLSGPLPIHTALVCARQIAEALEYAHEKGIVHRDLKPSNVRLTSGGVVKVLDFGLAKASQQSAGGDPSMSPTESLGVTDSGTILGTAAYMSPEQAGGKAVDKRTDIWSFGVVLWEMLAGECLFQGESVAHTLANVLRAEIDFSKLPPQTPAPIRGLLMRCLDRDVTTRLRDLGEARVLIQRYLTNPESASVDGAVANPQSPHRQHPRSWPAWAAAVVVGIVGMGAWMKSFHTVEKLPSLALTIIPPSGKPLASVGSQFSVPEISPDGSAVLYAAGGGYNVRRLDSLDSKFVPGSTESTGAAFWSPDSSTVVYPTEHQLMKVRIPDGAPEVVMPLPGPTRAGSWSTHGTILIAAFPFLALAPSGGDAIKVDVPLLSPGPKKNPEFLPGSEDFLFLSTPNGAAGDSELCLATLQNGKAVNPVRLLKTETAARYTEAGGGRILFVRDDNLYSQKLNRAARRLEGEAELVVRGVSSQPNPNVGRGDFSVSRTGVVAWRPGRAALNQITIFDRTGNQVGTTGPPGPIVSLILSPDQTQILALGERAWIFDVGQPGRQLLPPANSWIGWSGDGSKVLGLRSAARGGEAKANLVEFSINGLGAVRDLGRIGIDTNPQDISPDGTQLLSMPRSGGIWVTPLSGPEEARVSRVFVDSGERISGLRFSPDGRWVLYSNGGLFVQPFPGPGRRQLAAPDGRISAWRGDGKEIVYLGPQGVMSVGVDIAGSQLRLGPPRKLFSSPRMPAGSNASIRPLAVSRDGSRIYFVQGVEQPDYNMIHIKMGGLK